MNKYFQKLIKWTDIKILEIKKCKYCGSDFPIYDIEKKLLDKHWFKETEQCSTCTFKMLNSYFNDKHLYSRKDSESWENIISVLSSDYRWKVLEAKKYKKILIDDYALDFSQNIWKNMFCIVKINLNILIILKWIKLNLHQQHLLYCLIQI